VNLESLAAQVAALQAEVAWLREQFGKIATAEAILRRAHANVPDSVLYPEAKPPRPGHLHAVKDR
jgi:prefoldin subunit 5